MRETSIGRLAANLLGWARTASLLCLVLLLPVPALACGAEGGDERPTPGELICDPDAPVASHPGVDPAGGTRNPIDPVTGNKYLRQRDARAAGGLLLARHYNSRNDFPSALGPGWRHGFEVVLAVHRRGDRRRAQIIQGDGRRIVFETGGPGQAWRFRALEPGYGQLLQRPDGPPDRQWLWRWRNGSQLSFDHLGRLSAVDHADGRRFRLTYGGQRCQLLEVRTPGGARMAFHYDGDACRVLAVTLANGRRIEYGYDATGLLRSVARQGERLWRYAYDDAHRAALVRVLDGQGRVHGAFAYGLQGRVVSSATGDARETITADYRLPSSAEGIGETRLRDRAGRETRVRWRIDRRTQVRRLLSIEGERCAACPPVGWRWRYDAVGRMIGSEYAPGGLVSRLRRDDAGRVVAKTLRAGGVTRHWWFGYDASGPFDRLRTIETDSVAPGRRHRISLHYDAFDRLVSVEQTGWQPDLQSLARAAGGWRFGRFTALRRTRSVTYGVHGAAAGRVVEIAVDGRPVARYDYDSADGSVRLTDAGGLQWTQRRDAQGRVTAIERPDGSRWQARWRDDAVTVSDRGVTREIALGADGLPVTVSASDAPALGFERAWDGTVTAVTSHGGHRIDLQPADAPADHMQMPREVAALVAIDRADLGERAYRVFDDFGRMLAQIDPLVGVRRFAYDAQDRLVARADGRGPALRIVRDPAGRVLSIEDAHARPGVVFGYEAGRLVSRTDPAQSERIGYDTHGRAVHREIHLRDPATHQRVGPIRLENRFDAGGRLVLRILHDAFALQYRWRPDNTLAGIDLVHPDGRSTILIDDCRWLPFAGGANGLLAARFGNGTRLQRQLDAGLRTLEVRHLPPPGRPGTLPVLGRRIDATGRTIAWRLGGVEHSLGYDDHGHLVADAHQRWNHDRHGTPIPGTVTAAKAAPAGPRAWFDRAGLVRVAAGTGGPPVRYLRNAAAERIAKIRPGRPAATQWFVHEGRRPLMMLDADGRLRRVFLHVDHLPVAVVDVDGPRVTVSWLHADYRGLPRALTDAHGRLRWSGEFGAYGALTAARWHGPPLQGFGIDTDRGLPSPVPMRLPGQYHDAETGLHHNDQRLFDPHAARYLSPDPLGLRPTGLPYAYADNQPYDRADPLGLYEIDIHYYMTYFIARTAGIEHNAAYRIALAAQGIDDNPLTQPINIDAGGQPDYAGSLISNQERLLAYHFVLSERETTRVRSGFGLPAPQLMAQLPSGTVIGIRRNEPGWIEIDTVRPPSAGLGVANPRSPQLDRLMNAALAGSDPCSQAHLLGEFVHAFQDTYSHRDHENRPYDPVIDFMSLGLGHGQHMHDPDWTFNHGTSLRPEPVVLPTGLSFLPRVDTPDGRPRFQYVDWSVNEDRTLQMERDLHTLLSRFGDPDKAVPFEMIEDAMREFNATHEWQRHGESDAVSFPNKLALLERELEALGYGVETSPVRFVGRSSGPAANARYDEAVAIRNREGALCDRGGRPGVIQSPC